MPKSTLDLLATRRSIKPDQMQEPGPDAAQLQQILTIAARVPDHKKLVPWRFVIFEGDARAAFGEKIVAACEAEESSPPSKVRLDMERKRLMRAPVVVAVISRTVKNAGAPEWEQILSAGAACYNLCIAANAMGFATNWLTEWIAYSPKIRADLGLAENERVAGFIYIGTSSEQREDRERPDLADIATRWSAA